MDRGDNGEKQEVDALCKECGHGFKVFIDRMAAAGRMSESSGAEVSCPICGCGQCRIGH